MMRALQTSRLRGRTLLLRQLLLLLLQPLAVWLPVQRQLRLCRLPSLLSAALRRQEVACGGSVRLLHQQAIPTAGSAAHRVLLALHQHQRFQQALLQRASRRWQLALASPLCSGASCARA